MLQRSPHATTSASSSLTDRRGLVPAAVPTADAAAYISRSPAFLKKARIFGRGPAFCRTGRSILYRIADLDAWLEGHVVRPGA